jgi:5-methyltetrahydropteroyltriglutamate--homocysteine methyltransferase
MHSHSIGKISREQLLAAEDAALRNTLARFEHTGSPIITDGEQSKL